MKASFLFSDDFVKALQSLYGAKLPVKTAYKVATLKDVIEKEATKIYAIRQSTIEKYYKLDDDGAPAKDASGNFLLSDIEALTKELEAINDITIDVAVEITADELDRIELSGSEVFALLKSDLLK